MESVNFDREIRDRTWFSHLVLGANVSDLSDATKVEGYDVENIEVSLKINGVEIETKTFNTIMKDWSDRIADGIKEELKHAERMSDVRRNAETLIEEKLGKLREVLDNVENQLYKLYEE